MHVTGGRAVGRQNLNDLLHVALFTMRICSCRVSRLLVVFRSITRGRPSQLSICLHRRGFHRQSDLAFTSHGIN